MRTIEEIYQEMLEVFAQRTGYLPHSACDLAARLYAAAAQLQALEAQADWALDQCFPQTAQGVYLDYHADSRGLSRTAAAAAVGTLRFSVDEAAEAALAIPAGTVCMTAAGVRFQTTEDGAIPAGGTQADVPARAVESGTAGNVGVGTVVLMAAAPAGIQRCTNPAAFTGGMDAEDDASLRQRILDSYRRLPNGANAAYYEQAAMAYPGVAAAQAVGRARGIGTVDVYIASAAGEPEESLRQAVEADLQSRREIAVDLEVLAPVEKEVDIQAVLYPGEGFSFQEAKAAAEAALASYFSGRLLGQPVTLAALGNLLYGLESVANYRFLAPAADVAAAEGQLPVLGTVTITEPEVE